MRNLRWQSCLRFLLAACLFLTATVSVCAQAFPDGMAAYNRGEYERAYEIFSDLFRSDPGNEEINFALGMAAMGMGRYSHAAFAFERIVMMNPGNNRARLELGRAYFAMGQYELAREEFQAARGVQLPEPVEENVKKYLKKIDQLTTRWDFSGQLSLSVFYDDNVNYGPASENVDTLIGVLQVVSNTLPDETWGGAVSAGLSLSYDPGRRGYWQYVARLNGYQNWLDDASEEEIRFGRGALGLRRLGKRTIFDLSARADALDYGNESLLRMYAADPTLLVIVGDDWHLISRFNYELRDYQDNDARDSDYVRAGQALRYHFGRRPHNITIEANAFEESADEDPFTNSGWETAMALEVSLPWQMVIYGVAKYREVEYDEVLYPDLQAQPREDEQVQFVGGLRKKTPWNVEFDFNYRHVNNESNFGLYEYDRNVAAFTSFVRF